ncbi:helix-turn-helix transcriptional regulator [Acinetobacter sp.]|uniref:helix-turn-helix transcriptional regulator n=1 Tax=Acinetobacter sp. TaxID=472 RepID=UPI00388FD6D7
MSTTIDRRVRASEFMQLLAVGREKFYKMINRGEIEKPIKITDRDVFWYESYVKNKVEEHKPKSDTMAHI